MKTDPVSPQGRHTVTVGDVTLTVETPPDLDALLDRAAANDPQAVDAIPYYAILWPAARGLADYLWQHRAELCGGTRVIELGCGLGLPSILAARLGARVLATDFHPDTGMWLLHNAALNGATLDYQQLDWSEFLDWRSEVRDRRSEETERPPQLSDLRPPTSDLRPADSLQPYSLIIGSDLLYEKRHIPALVCAIDALCAPGGRAVIADPGRDNLPLFVSSMEKSGWRHTLHPEGDIYVCRFERG
jgi:predicted nicotinamide N-methyase